MWIRTLLLHFTPFRFVVFIGNFLCMHVRACWMRDNNIEFMSSWTIFSLTLLSLSLSASLQSNINFSELLCSCAMIFHIRKRWNDFTYHMHRSVWKRNAEKANLFVVSNLTLLRFVFHRFIEIQSFSENFISTFSLWYKHIIHIQHRKNNKQTKEMRKILFWL